MTEPLLTIAETADQLHLSKPTIRRWIHDGTLPAYKLGGQVRIKESDIDALLEASLIQPPHAATNPPLRRRPAPAAGGLRQLLHAEHGKSVNSIDSDAR